MDDWNSPEAIDQEMAMNAHMDAMGDLIDELIEIGYHEGELESLGMEELQELLAAAPKPGDTVTFQDPDLGMVGGNADGLTVSNSSPKHTGTITSVARVVDGEADFRIHHVTSGAGAFQLLRHEFEIAGKPVAAQA